MNMPGKLAAEIDTERAVHQAPFPMDKNRLNSFLGACNVYRWSFKYFSKRSRPLSAMIKKGIEPD